MVARLPRTLIIDFYDSYTLNLLTLFSPYPDELVRQQIVVVRFDAYSWCASSAPSALPAR